MTTAANPKGRSLGELRTMLTYAKAREFDSDFRVRMQGRQDVARLTAAIKRAERKTGGNPLLMTVVSNSPRSRRNPTPTCEDCRRQPAGYFELTISPDSFFKIGPSGSFDGAMADPKMPKRRWCHDCAWHRSEWHATDIGKWAWDHEEKRRNGTWEVFTVEARYGTDPRRLTKPHPVGACNVRTNPRHGRAARRNPTLMLVTSNPPVGAVERVKAAWAKFHHHEFDGRVRRFEAIPGGPSVVFVLGECVAIDFGTGDARPNGVRPLVCGDPTDDSLWLVAQGGALDLSKCHGKALHALTYAPVRTSGKEDADFRHDFHRPLPRLKAIGRPGRCKAALLDGGRYYVKDWIYE